MARLTDDGLAVVEEGLARNVAPVQHRLVHQALALVRRVDERLRLARVHLCAREVLHDHRCSHNNQ